MLQTNATLTLLLALCVSCAPRIPADYARHEAAAEAATTRRDHVGAAREWAKAANVATDVGDRQEARYRQATSALRAGNASEHQRILRLLAATPGPRQERAIYDLATTEFNRDPVSGRTALRAALIAHPGSGLARGALDRLLSRLDASQRIAVLQELSRTVDDPQLRERMLLLQARSYEKLGDRERALQLYEQQVREFPYPHGRYWDESLLRVSALRLAKGDVSRAAATLEGMLTFREQASIVGSYDRQYAEATLLLAYVLLPQNWERAYSLLRSFPSRHSSSRKQDDAVWSAMLLAHAHERQEDTCEHAGTMVAKWPESRYSACVSRYCPTVEPTGECKAYVLTQRSNAQAVLEIALEEVLVKPN